MNDWREKQQIKTTDARTLLRQKIANMASTFHLDEKMQLAVLNHGFKMLELKGLLAPEFEDMDTAAKVGMVMPDMIDYVRTAFGKGGPKTPATTPPKAPEKILSLEEEALKNIRAGKK
jgi:hypothetical protein